MAIANWTELETIEGIITGRITPETLPFAALDADKQAEIIDEIDAVCDDVASGVLEAYPDLDDPAQRLDRLRMYRAEVVRRQDGAKREAYGAYFDVLHGVCLRNAAGPRTYVADESGCLELIVA